VNTLFVLVKPAEKSKMEVLILAAAAAARWAVARLAVAERGAR
jgi:hypothetical protein